MMASPLGIPKLPASFPHLGRGRTNAAHLPVNSRVASISSAIMGSYEQSKLVWVWTKSRQVMTAAVERGWNTFLFSSKPHCEELAKEWSSASLIYPLFIKGPEIFDEDKRRVAALFSVSSPQELELLHPDDKHADNVVISFQGEWQVIPAENLVAAFQGCRSTVLAVSSSSSEAQVFLEALEQGLGGVVLKVEDAGDILKLKDYFDRRNEARNTLSFNKATITRVEIVGMGDRVCVDLCSLMRPGEGILGPVHAYVAVPGGRTCYLSELQAGKEVIVVNQSGLQRSAIVGRVKIESRPLILIEAEDGSSHESYSIFLQNAETVAFVSPIEADKSSATMIPVTSLKAGDKVLLRVQGGARHTGIEIQEFILEK